VLALALALTVCATDAPFAQPKPLEEARRLADQLRYEEAVVEYQRYLGLEDRPAPERAQALLELGFIHLVLGDEANAHARGEQALELDPKLSLPASAPARQREFLSSLQEAARTKTKVSSVPSRADDPPATVRAKLKDPQNKVKRVLLRHALAANGPFHSVSLECTGEECSGQIPPPLDVQAFTAWYFVEALDDGAHTLATAGTAATPLQLSVVGRRAWYQSPVTWGVAGAALIAVSLVIYLLSPPPPK
jgi:hypothetical protein